MSIQKKSLPMIKELEKGVHEFKQSAKESPDTTLAEVIEISDDDTAAEENLSEELIKNTEDIGISSDSILEKEDNPLTYEQISEVEEGEIVDPCSDSSTENPSTEDFSWRAVRMLMVGDERAKYPNLKHLNNFPLQKFYFKLHASFIDACLLVDKSLAEGFDVVLIFGFHYDFVTFAPIPGHPETLQFMGAKENVNLQGLLKILRYYHNKWVKLFPFTKIIWSLPYQCNFWEYNKSILKSAGEVLNKKNIIFEKNEEFSKKYHSLILNLQKVVKQMCPEVPFFPLNRVIFAKDETYLKNKTKFRLPDDLVEGLYMNQTSTDSFRKIFCSYLLYLGIRLPTLDNSKGRFSDISLTEATMILTKEMSAHKNVWEPTHPSSDMSTWEQQELKALMVPGSKLHNFSISLSEGNSCVDLETAKSLQNLKDVYNRECQKYRERPELHPLFADERQNFTEKKIRDIVSHGGDPFTYDVTKDWLCYWSKRMEEIFLDSWQTKESNYLSSLHLKEESKSSKFSKAVKKRHYSPDSKLQRRNFRRTGSRSVSGSPHRHSSGHQSRYHKSSKRDKSSRSRSPYRPFSRQQSKRYKYSRSESPETRSSRSNSPYISSSRQHKKSCKYSSSDRSQSRSPLRHAKRNCKHQHSHSHYKRHRKSCCHYRKQSASGSEDSSPDVSCSKKHSSKGHSKRAPESMTEELSSEGVLLEKLILPEKGTSSKASIIQDKIHFKQEITVKQRISVEQTIKYENEAQEEILQRNSTEKVSQEYNASKSDVAVVQCSASGSESVDRKHNLCHPNGLAEIKNHISKPNHETKDLIDSKKEFKTNYDFKDRKKGFEPKNEPKNTCKKQPTKKFKIDSQIEEYMNIKKLRGQASSLIENVNAAFHGCDKAVAENKMQDSDVSGKVKKSGVMESEETVIPHSSAEIKDTVKKEIETTNNELLSDKTAEYEVSSEADIYKSSEELSCNYNSTADLDTRLDQLLEDPDFFLKFEVIDELKAEMDHSLVEEAESVFPEGSNVKQELTSDIAHQSENSLNESEIVASFSVLMKFIELDFVDILKILQMISGKLGSYGVPVTNLYGSVTLFCADGQDISKLLTKENISLIEDVRHQLSTLVNDVNLTSIQRAISLEAYERINSFLAKVNEKKLKFCDVNMHNIARATIGQDKKGIMDFIKHALLYDGYLNVADEQLMNIYAVVKAKQGEMTAVITK